MATEPQTTAAEPAQPANAQPRPNESGHIHVQGYFRVFDRADNRVLVEGRA